MSNNTSVTVKITRRRSCRCGCKGQDSWHRKTVRRVVSNIVRDDSAMERAEAAGRRFAEAFTGTIKMPYGEQEVVGTAVFFGDTWRTDVDAWVMWEIA